jgi:signal peptidase I
MNENNLMAVSASDFIKVCFDWLESIAQAMVVVIFALAFVFRIVSIDGNSMLNTLNDKDKAFVYKFNYVPHNSDVVVIARGPHINVPIIKRVIAVEGDTLDVNYSDGTVAVNGKVLDEPYIAEHMHRRAQAEVPKVIPKGTIFVMGDNRNYSTDSNDFGVVDVKYVIGKAVYIIFPFYRIGSIK